MNAQLQTIPLPQTEPIQPRFNIPRWNPALRIAFRFCMVYLGLYCFATQLITAPTGADIPDLATVWLLQPFGTFSPYGVLMSTVGAAPAYEIFTGCAMVAGGLLLIVPRTATLGALISLADTIQVFMLAMTYDVPAKLLAFHLILLSCFLLTPDVAR